MLYGVLIFVLQYTSRRQANEEITNPMFEQNLRLLFPELETLPHADTLFRLLSKIDVDQIAHAHIDLVDKLIRNKKFISYRAAVTHNFPSPTMSVLAGMAENNLFSKLSRQAPSFYA